MILPQPESNLKLNLIVLGADIIDILSRPPYKNRFVIVDDVMNKFLNRDKDRTSDLFLDALTFLYILGIIERKGYKIKLVKIESEESQTSLFDNHVN